MRPLLPARVALLVEVCGSMAVVAPQLKNDAPAAVKDYWDHCH